MNTRGFRIGVAVALAALLVGGLVFALRTTTGIGKTLGTLVNTITASGNGGRVLYATPPDIGYSPFAASEVASAGSSACVALFRRTNTPAVRYWTISEGSSEMVCGSRLLGSPRITKRN